MESCGGLAMRIDRKSSIEKEPRTLNFAQIKYAREAALCVMNTRSIEEAMEIFTEGLEPVVNGAQSSDKSMGVRGEFTCFQPQFELPDGVRDIVTAPF